MQGNIRGVAAVRMFLRCIPPILVYIMYLSVVELGEICSMSVRHLDAEIHTNMPIFTTTILQLMRC